MVIASGMFRGRVWRRENFKQVTVDDDPAGIRWIKLVTNKNKNIEAKTDTT